MDILTHATIGNCTRQKTCWFNLLHSFVPGSIYRRSTYNKYFEYFYFTQLEAMKEKPDVPTLRQGER